METIKINTAPQYDVIINGGLLPKIGKIIKNITDYKKIAIVTDSNVAFLYLEKVVNALLNDNFEVCTFVVPAGESSKSYRQLENIHNFLAENQITRTDLIIAFGGGVVGDLVGYASSGYLRGVDFAQIPTTLLAMIDSSVGGKVAINIPAGKNLVGAFYQPKVVVCDTDVLNTLSEEIIKDGIGEIAKYAILEECGLFEDLLCDRDKLDLSKIISKCVKIKDKYVSEDTFDIGVRQKLNLGHTLAHVIEKDSKYEISHGKAVFIGLNLITQVFNTDTQTQEIAQKLSAVAQKYGMQKEYVLSAQELWKMAGCDKKRKGDYIDIVRPYAIGDCRLEKVFVYNPINLTQATMKKKFDIEVFPSVLNGKIIAPPSKSALHRLLIAGALSGRLVEIRNVNFSMDIKATYQALEAMGAILEIKNNTVFCRGFNKIDNVVIDCNESGSTLRFLIPICAMLGIEAIFIGSDRLSERSVKDIVQCLSLHGVKFDREDNLPINISGSFFGSYVKINGELSSQYISGLLLGAYAAKKDISIEILGKTQSLPYIMMTIDVLKKFGCRVEMEGNKIIFKYYENNADKFVAEGDYSNGAFFLCAGVEVDFNDLGTLQGDKEILRLYKKLQNGYEEIDVGNIPDLAPILAVMMTRHGGKIVNGARLKAKECDRLLASFQNLTKLGVNCEMGEDSLTVYKSELVGGVEVQGFNDHRIVMAMAIAGLNCKYPITITQANAVNKSYPNFWEEYARLGGIFNVINVR